MLMMFSICVHFFSFQNPHWIWFIQVISFAELDAKKSSEKSLDGWLSKKKINGKFLIQSQSRFNEFGWERPQQLQLVTSSLTNILFYPLHSRHSSYIRPTCLKKTHCNPSDSRRDGESDRHVIMMQHFIQHHHYIIIFTSILYTLSGK